MIITPYFYGYSTKSVTQGRLTSFNPATVTGRDITHHYIYGGAVFLRERSNSSLAWFGDSKTRIPRFTAE